MENLRDIPPSRMRELIRKNEWIQSTSGVSSGYIQANIVILHADVAFEFMQFCIRNPKSCPLLDVTDIGSSKPMFLSANANLKTDLGKYRVYREGRLSDQPTDLNEIWEKDMVGFLLGCSLTFERALIDHGIELLHFQSNRPVSMYKTNIPCMKAGRFEGPMVVSMRPIPENKVIDVVQITSRYPFAHGAPVHIGSPESIGISDLNRPDFGSAVPIPSGFVPVFWACGVTPQAAAIESKIDLMITHEPGYMFISDLRDEELTLS